MEINSLHGANAYNSAPSATLPTDNTQLREQNIEASRSDISTQNTAALAFEVSITQEAQDRLAAETSTETSTETSQEPTEAQAAPPETASNGATPPAQDASQIVNIVA